MTDRPIIFSVPMIRALLEGRKSQTRRMAWKLWRDPDMRDEMRPSKWQRVQPGDRLWVRESGVQLGNATDDGRERDGYEVCGFRYTSDGSTIYLPGKFEGHDYEASRPSIHMLRWASRLTLTVIAVRVERLQDISEEDARAEGMADIGDAEMKRIGIDGLVASTSGRRSFWLLWDHLHGPAAWNANPAVTVINFDVAKRNIDE